MHHDGEVDVRATYTILACAQLLNLPKQFLFSSKVLGFVQSCQTFEGGFGGEMGSEAHGGYTYCAVASLYLLWKNNTNHDSLDQMGIDLPSLCGWLARRQMYREGGFCGRANKLVDGCYSFWQGVALDILSMIYYNKNKNNNNDP